MSRPESDILQRSFRPASENEIEFKIDKKTDTAAGVALPLNLRKEAIAAFDREATFQLTTSQQKVGNQVQISSTPEIAESLTSAQLLHNEGEFQLAQGLYRSVLRLDGKNEIAIRGLAESSRSLGEHEEAVRVLKKLAEHHRTPGNLLLLAEQLYALNYNEDALQIYMSTVSDPSLDEQQLFAAFKNIGNIHLRLGDANGAEEFYNKAYTLFPDSDVLLVNFGSLSLFRGDTEKALKRFRDAVHFNDRNDKAWVGLGMIHREYGDSELAWANIEKALDINPSNESAIKLLVEWAMKDNEIEKAVSRVGKFLEIFPDDAFMQMMFAKFLYFSGHLEKAEAAAEKSIRLNPDSDEAMGVIEIIRQEIRAREVNKR